MERIRKDQSRADARLSTLLGYIAENLFDPDLNVNHLKRACAVRNNSIPVQFRSTVGMPPGAYITDCRLGVAARLLQDTDLPVWEVGELVGYSTLQVFSEAFFRWAGLRPSAYRKRKCGEEASGGVAGRDLLDPDQLRKACAGGLPQEEGLRLIRSLRDIYCTQSGSFDEESAACGEELSPVRDRAAEALARAAWETLEDLPHEEQRRLVQERFRFPSPALFDLLRQKSREVGTDRRRKGLELAELALDSLYACGRSVPELELLNLRARGWAWLANARRMAFDLRGAQAAMAAAEGNLPRVGADRLVLAEILELKAALRCFQNRTDEASELQERAVALFRRIGRPKPLATALITKATILYYREESSDVLPTLAEARQLLSRSGDRFLRLCLLNNLSVQLVEVGRLGDAAETLKEAWALAREEGSPYLTAHLRWSEALLQQARGSLEAALRLLRDSRQAFLDLELAHHAAVVALDLAILHLNERRQDRVEALIEEILPTLATLEQHQAIWPALRLLQDAHAARRLPLSVLQAVRRQLKKLQLPAGINEL